MNHSPPKTIGAAIQMLLLSAILFLLCMVMSYAIFRLTSEASMISNISIIATMTGDVLIYLALMTACLIGIYRGQNWARYLYLIYVCIRFTTHYFTHSISARSSLLDLLVATYWIMVVIAVTLLFSPESNLYFKGKHQRSQPLHLKRPPTVTIALQVQLFNLAIFVAGAAAAIMYYHAAGLPTWHLSMNSTIEVLIDTPCHLIIMAILLSAMYKHKAWARIVFTFYVIYRLLFHYYTTYYMQYTSGFELLVYAFHLLNFVSLTLLYCPSSNFWFRHTKQNKKNSKKPWENNNP